MLLGVWLSLFWGVVGIDSWFVLGRSDVFLGLSVYFGTEVFLRLIISTHIILLQTLIVFLLCYSFLHFFNTPFIVTALIVFRSWLCIDLHWFLIDRQYLGDLLGDFLSLRGRKEPIVFDVSHVVMLVLRF